MIEDVVALCAAQVGDKKLRIQIDFPEEIGSITVGDGDRVRQVLLNLVGNAVRFTPAGSVTIAVERIGEQRGARKISIIDTGPGVPEKIRGSIFESFVRAEQEDHHDLGRGAGPVDLQGAGQGDGRRDRPRRHARRRRNLLVYNNRRSDRDAWQVAPRLRRVSSTGCKPALDNRRRAFTLPMRKTRRRVDHRAMVWGLVRR